MMSSNGRARESRAVTDSPLGPLTLVAADGKLAGLYMNGRTPDSAAAAAAAAGTAAAEEAAAGAGAAEEALAETTAATEEAAAAGETAAQGTAAAEADEAVLAETARQLAEYFAGERQSFDLPLALDGTAFQRRVWDALRGIGYGETVSYGELADQIGQPTAARAVGLANGRNPVSIIVPCHRVVGSDGSLTGYGGGVANKQRLLDLERRISQDSADPERTGQRPAKRRSSRVSAG
jgi:methylated-DNA-[protein]-cysteine S-methyltransferase